MGITNVSVNFRFGDQGGNRVDNDDIDPTGTDQNLGDLQGLLTVVRLRDQQVVDIDSQALGIAGVEGMFGVDKRRGASGSLGLSNNVQGQGRLTGRFRTVDLGNPSFGESPDPKGDIQA